MEQYTVNKKKKQINKYNKIKITSNENHELNSYQSNIENKKEINFLFSVLSRELNTISSIKLN